MKPETRQKEIIARLAAIQKEWKVEELAAAMRISAITIRRDLETLHKQGAIIRTFGGCLIDNRNRQAAYFERVAKNFQLKQVIGRAAVAEIKKGDVVLLNDGSTIFHLAGCLDQCGPIVVYTNSISMFGEISRFPNVSLNILGGTYHSDYSYLGGSFLERILETVMADVAFVGTDSISPEGDCYCQNEDMARIAQLMIRRARRAVLLADHNKVGTWAKVRFGGLKDFAVWITSKGLKGKVRKKLSRLVRLKEVGG